MLKSASDFGISDGDWQTAKQEAKSAMIERAKVRGAITYSDLVARIQAVKFHAHDTRLFHMLGEISVEENEAERGMLSVIVVHKRGDMQPGQGFFILGAHLGYKTQDMLQFWSDQMKKVHAAWSLPTS